MNWDARRCHEINGVQRPENFAPELSTIGSKPLAQIVFLPAWKHSLPSYIVAKIRQPRAFGPSVKMPQFTSDRFADRCVDHGSACAHRPRPHHARQLRVAAIPETNYQPAGHAGKLITELACFSCHRFNGRGGDMAPDLSWEGSSVQRQWLTDFLHNPNTLRPSLIRRMPRFNLSDSDNKELTDYILTVYQSPAIDPDLHINAWNYAGTVEHGRQLFYSKYACQACHIVDTKTDKGYIGPTLTQVGSRLTPAWVYAWLKNPQALRPGYDRTKSEPQRRRRPRADSFPDVAERSGRARSEAMMRRFTASMKRRTSAALALLSFATLAGCKHTAPVNAGLKATAQGTALVESSGGDQVGVTGTALKDPLVVQVNDDSWNRRSRRARRISRLRGRQLRSGR